MKLEDMDLAEIPPHLAMKVERQFYLWAAYTPTTIEKDIPFEQDWWKYVYWLPKIKKEFYMMTIKELKFNTALIELCDKYGMDFWWFSVNYKEFIKRLEWMRRSGMTHIGEVKNE